MSHRTLLILSIILVVVGIIGIFSHTNDKQEIPTSIEPAIKNERVIQVAKSIRDLAPHEIISAEDYTLSSITVSENTPDNREMSTFSKGDVNGFVVRNHINKDTYLTAEMIESPESATFIQHSLKENEVPYSLIIKPSDSYFFSILHSGDKVSLYLRYSKRTEGKKTAASLIQEVSGRSGGKESTNMDIVIEKLSVLEVKPFDKIDPKDVAYRGDDSAIGIVVVKVTSEQFAQLKLIEGSGDMILIPDNYESGAINNMQLDKILPNFHNIKELRGSK